MHYILEILTHDIRKKYEVEQNEIEQCIRFVCDEDTFESDDNNEWLYHKLTLIIDSIIIKYQMDVSYPSDYCSEDEEKVSLFTIEFAVKEDYEKFCEELDKLQLLTVKEEPDDSSSDEEEN